MRQIVRQSCQQKCTLRGQINIRDVVKKAVSKSEPSDYLTSKHLKRVQQMKQTIDVDEFTGATSRKTMYQQYYQDQPSVQFFYPMHKGRGLQSEPDCRWTGNEFLEKICSDLGPTIATCFKDLDTLVKEKVNKNEELIKQNLEKIFREKYPNKEFDYDREYTRYLKLDSKKFKKEYGFDSD